MATPAWWAATSAFRRSFYSAFAGFVEPGETMEEAVRRELLEEVNLQGRRGAPITPPSPGRFRHP